MNVQEIMKAVEKQNEELRDIIQQTRKVDYYIKCLNDALDQLQTMLEVTDAMQDIKTTPDGAVYLNLEGVNNYD